MFQRKTFVSALLASAMALPAFAQDAAPAAEPAAEPEFDSRSEIEEINVTARKVSENLQDTPVAVSAFNAESLEGLGIADTQDISSMAPNLYLTQTPGSVANLALSIRGVAGAEPLLTREQGVALYMDGAYIARVTGAIMDLVDVERVEVLRGPQGTLYGRNSTGGAVNFISRKPTEDFSFSQRVGTGSWSKLESRTVVNTGELLPGLAATLAYFHTQEDGYRNNTLRDQNSDYGARNNDAFRIALGWDATETLRFDYSFDHSNLQGHGPGFQLVAISPDLAGALTAGGINVNNLKISRGVGTTGPFPSHKVFHELSGNFDGESEHTIRGHNLQVGWDLGFTNFTGIVTYRDWDNTEAGTELDGNSLGTLTAITNPAIFAPVGPPPLAPYFGAFCPGATFTGCFGSLNNPDLFNAQNERHQDQWSVETRFDGDLVIEDLRYVAGFYYFNEDFSENNPQTFLFPATPTLPPLATGNNFRYQGDSRSWAVFSNLTYTLPFMDDKLSISAGVRYSSDEKSFHRFTPINSIGNNDWNSVDWDTALNFAATEDITVYFRAASAYKAGGYNLRTALSVVDPFNEERVKSVELGVKSGWFDNRAQVNVTGFWSISRDRQTDVFAAGLTGATSVTINAGEAEIPGLELEAILIPFDGLTISGNVGWIKPKYNSYPVLDPQPVGPPIEVDLAHEAAFGYQPKVTTSLGVAYETAPIGSMGLVLGARVDAHYTSSRIWSPLDDERTTNDTVVTAFRDVLRDGGYWLTDVRFTVSEIALNERAKIRASVYGKNILDEDYMLSGIDFGALGFAGAAYGEGATWGIDITLDI
jgi:iron complex outermembrane receptor protein